MRTSLTLSVEGFDIAADIERLTELTGTIANTLAQVASDYGEPAVKTAAREARGTLSMSRNRQASELGTLAIVRPGVEHAETEIVAVPRGAWHLVEYGAKPHKIDTKRGYAGRAKKKALTTSYGLFSNVDHPGTAGTGTWTTAMANAEPIIDLAVQDAFDEAVTGGELSGPPAGAV